MIKVEDSCKNSKMPQITTKNQLPESKFGLGSDNSDLIILVLKYMHIVALVFLVWMIGIYRISFRIYLLCAYLNRIFWFFDCMDFIS